MGSCFSAESRSPHPTSPSSAFRKNKNSKKRFGSRATSFEYWRNEPLHRIPGRIFLNGSTQVASLFTQQGKKGTNQDAMIVWENFCSRQDTIFCGVFDGHGPFGHMVAKRVRDSLPLKLNAHWEPSMPGEEVLKEISVNNAGSMNSEEATFVSADEESRASIDVEEIEKHPEIFQTLKESFLKAFKVMDRELKNHQTIDCFCSGTTAVTLVKQGCDLVIGNVGDSRAVLGTREKDDSLVAVQLTVDLKPNLPAEAERIRKCKGRVFALQDEPEVARVWLPNNDSPGLAMARAFGDFCLKDFGLISVPEVSYRRLTEKDEFVVLATDGIWDVLSNKEVVDIIAAAPRRSTAARSLVESAVRAWRYKYPTSKVDDCAVVCLFLDSNMEQQISSASHAKSKEQASSGIQVNGDDGEDVSGPNVLVRSGTCRGSNGTNEESNEEEEIDAESEKEWSALEGVSRVNTLLNLPRFVPDKEDKDAAGIRKRK
ncbi:probable protein phosphatase 2C 33 isoform X2 [Gastrolobium bilobum]|uniref:probable protein phosphatase 2C 33 isoform X2 n=1 Tax=Gastrolobium bilobum TaxID=150636 RepID=UPI002AB0FB9E|nr:probable protein phosphatase 2C 33 isoform X2 [Gastrolobium bilobum]